MSLADELRAAGLHVEEDPGWQVRGNPWARGKPVGIMEHHTAPPVPFPISRLNGSTDKRIKCNMNTKPDGTVWLVAYQACNYSSGLGSSVVFVQALRGEAPTQNAADRNLQDNMNGNPFFWNIENDHPGDGSPIPQVQLDAIETATRVVADHYGLVYESVIGHCEWTSRKRDPYWNADYRCIAQIREALMPTADEIARAVWEFKAASGEKDGERISIWYQLDRDYRNINELISAHRSGTLGVDISQADQDALVNAIADSIEGMGLVLEVTGELTRRAGPQ